MTKELTLPFTLFIIFFLIQALLQPSELLLTLLIILISLIIFLVHRNKKECTLYLTGLVTGLFIEVVLGIFGRQQSWQNASLLGVPFWLPLAWGIGFVLITRLGIAIRK